MSLFTIFRVALKALTRNKMRTGLTMLGMIIGVAAVITVVALGNGTQKQIEEQISSAGTNMITVRAGNFARGGVHMGMGSSTRLTEKDVDAIRKQVPSAQYIAAGVNTREQVVASNQNWSTRIQGTDIDYPVIRFWPMKYGEFFTTTHVDSAAKVAVLGVIVSDRLYGENIDPVGESIRIRNQSFRVIGVMAPKGSGSFGEDQDDIIIAPYTTVMKKLRGRRAVSIQDITISARSADELDRTVAEISQVLRAQHKLIPGDDDDFMVRTQEDMATMLTQVTGTMTGLLAGIAGVSLIVGGIGIMNIMLVSVTERTREIGIRMAVGAKSRDVLFQFLVEAVVLSLFGGLIGVSLGFAVSEGLTQLMALPAAIPLDAVVLAFGVAATIGIVFGVYPARKAAQLNPIDALRFE